VVGGAVSILGWSLRTVVAGHVVGWAHEPGRRPFTVQPSFSIVSHVPVALQSSSVRSAHPGHH
jgi:hypothetical protein